MSTTKAKAKKSPEEEKKYGEYKEYMENYDKGRCKADFVSCLMDKIISVMHRKIGNKE
jgi:hypothetical protein